MRKMLAAWFVAATLGTVLTGCVAEVRTHPPGERVEFGYVEHHPGRVWIAGHYERRHGDRIWIEGHWERRR